MDMALVIHIKETFVDLVCRLPLLLRFLAIHHGGQLA